MNDGITCYEGMDGYAIADKAQWEGLVRENERLRLTIEDYRRDTAVYMSALSDADSHAKESVQREMAALRAGIARLKRELVNATNEFDRVTGWGLKENQ
jgi:predicted RNase H-like nuclease (RuvC/YqgF family)